MADWWLELAEIFVPWRGIKEFYYAYFDLAYRWYEPTLLLQKKDETDRIVQHDKVFDEQCRHGCSLSLNVHSVCP